MVNEDNADDTSALKAHLKSLHASLAETGTPDEELRALLRQLDGDIHQLLQQRAAADLAPAPAPVSTSAPEYEGLATRAQELAAHFAAQHPRMEPALRQLGNMLSNMGI